MDSLFAQILERIQHWGAFAYGAMFFIAFLESFVLVGLVIPGTFVMIFLGFVASNGALDFWPLFAATFLGAVSGDYISFYIGARKGEWALSILPRFSKKVDYFKVGKDFFEKYGNKSVFIGRFMAMVRPFIPFVAGTFKMKWEPFLLWNVFGAFIWSLLYISIGYFFGYAWRSAAVWISRGSLLLLIIAFIVLTRFFRKKVTEPPKEDGE